MGENAVIPKKAEIQGFIIVEIPCRLDARLRGHDELWHILRRGRPGWRKGILGIKKPPGVSPRGFQDGF